jgi:hypothetical protein
MHLPLRDGRQLPRRLHLLKHFAELLQVNMKGSFLAGALLSIVMLVGSTSCSDKFGVCATPHTCTPGGTAAESGAPDTAGTGGTTGTGGTIFGGSGGSGAGGNTTSGSSNGGNAGESGASGSSADSGAGGLPSKPCDGACSGMKPLCDEPTDTCVECLESDDCTGSKKICDTQNACVECLASEDCDDPKTAKCNAGACAKCTSNDDCAHVDGKTVCDTKAGECVECTVADETTCAGKSCNPATRGCTTTPVGTKDLCEPCLADSECLGGNQADPDVRCVPMTYNSVPRVGGFCLRRVAKSCERPFKIPAEGKSLSGALAEAYCGINQETTRCEAILDHLRSQGCPGMMDSQCGCLRDSDNKCVGSGLAGLCRTVGVDADRCTYRCGINDDCPEGRTCSSTSPKYCK